MIALTAHRFRVPRLALTYIAVTVSSAPAQLATCNCPPPPTKQPKCAPTAEYRFSAGSSPAVSDPLRPGATGELKVVVLGDSVIWGDGLRPEHKFVYLFGQDSG